LLKPPTTKFADMGGYIPSSQSPKASSMTRQEKNSTLSQRVTWLREKAMRREQSGEMVAVRTASMILQKTNNHNRECFR
jgi:lauroyl/myristoyl acyltransferase